MTKFESLLTRDGQDPLTERGMIILEAAKLAFESRLLVLSKKRMAIMARITKLEDLAPYNEGIIFDLEDWDNKRIKLQADFDEVMIDLIRVDALYTEYFLDSTTTTTTTEEPLTTTSSTTEEPITTSTSTTVTPDVTTFYSLLYGAYEVPPVVSGGMGDATLVFNNTTKVFELVASYSGLTPTGAHIHVGQVGTEGPIVFALDHTINPIVFTSPPLTEQQESDLVTQMYYINLHTAAYPDGEIRGQFNS